MNDPNAFRAIGPTTYLCPTPAVLLGCADGAANAPDGEPRPNLVTVAWTGICCTKPPMLSVSLRPERYSHALISKSGEFTVNLIGEPLVKAMDFCGVKSGRDVDKFQALDLHAIPAPSLSVAPALEEAPAFLCCKVRQILPLGSHDLFLAEIVEVCVRDTFFRDDGSIDEAAMRLVAYVHGKYRALGAELGFFGYSVAGPDALKRRMPAEPRKRPPAAHRPLATGKVKTQTTPAKKPIGLSMPGRGAQKKRKSDT